MYDQVDRPHAYHLAEQEGDITSDVLPSTTHRVSKPRDHAKYYGDDYAVEDGGTAGV